MLRAHGEVFGPASTVAFLTYTYTHTHYNTLQYDFPPLFQNTYYILYRHIYISPSVALSRRRLTSIQGKGKQGHFLQKSSVERFLMPLASPGVDGRRRNGSRRRRSPPSRWPRPLLMMLRKSSTIPRYGAPHAADIAAIRSLSGTASRATCAIYFSRQKPPFLSRFPLSFRLDSRDAARHIEPAPAYREKCPHSARHWRTRRIFSRYDEHLHGDFATPLVSCDRLISFGAADITFLVTYISLRDTRVDDIMIPYTRAALIHIFATFDARWRHDITSARY